MATLRLSDGPSVHGAKGFTLIELMVVLAVLAVLAAVAAPSFIGMVASQRTSTTANELLAHLQYARTEATRASRKVTLCASDGTACTASTAWSGGWLIWTDLDKNGVLDASEVVRVQGSVHPQLSVSGPTELSFGPIGSAATTSFSVQHGDPAQARWVCVQATGAAQVQSTAC